MSRTTITAIVVLVCGNAQIDAQIPVGQTPSACADCHGNIIGQGPHWRYSYSSWQIGDKHAQAGLLLREQESRRIVRALSPGGTIPQADFVKTLQAKCASCHAPTAQAVNSSDFDDGLAHGVSCFDCHGENQGWVKAHVRADWPQKKQTALLGFVPMKSSVNRAETCVKCHVGDRSPSQIDRDVNHDLIAAGHPPLRFDFVMYHHNLNKHWNPTSNEEIRFESSPVRNHLVGNAITLAAAMDLSLSRSKDNVALWPELSEFNCFGCHRRLPKRPSISSRAQLAYWNEWHVSGAVAVLSPESQVSGLSFQTFIGNTSVDALFTDEIKRLREEAARLEKSNVDTNHFLIDTLNLVKANRRPNWTQAATVYRRLFAYCNEVDLKQKSELSKELSRDLEPLLRFNRGRSSTFESPHAFDPREFVDQLKAFALRISHLNSSDGK